MEQFRTRIRLDKNAYSTIILGARRSVQIGLFMKKFWYKLAMVAIVAALSIGFSVTAFAYDEAEINDIAEQYLNSWNEYDFQAEIDSGSVDTETLEMYTEWQTIKDSIGEFQEINGITITEEEGVLNAAVTATYTNSKLTFTVNFDLNMMEAYGTFNSIAGFDVVAGAGVSNSPDMGKAALNTLMGMGIVFIVLIAMIWIFSLIKYIPGIVEKFNSSSKEKLSGEVNQSADNVVAVINEEKEENLIDNSELVAVITGAIMAATANQETADGLVVRSIRRRR